MGILIQDSFAGVDGTPISSHMPEVGGAWSGVYSTISGNTLYCPHSSEHIINVTTAATFDCYAQITRLTAENLVDIWINCPNPRDQDHSDVLIASDAEFLLNDVVISYACPINAVYKIKRIGALVYGYIDGVLIATASARGTGHYFRIEPGNPAYYDDYEAGEATPPAAPTLLAATCSTGTGESTLPDAPIVDFNVDVPSGTAPLTVNFSDNSLGSPTSWLWEFSDGTTSTDQNSTHTFGEGIFTVRLTATNAEGSRSITATIVAYGPVIPPGAPSSIGVIGAYKVDTNNNQINILGPDGTILSTFGSIGTGNGQFLLPTTLSVVNGTQLLDRVVIGEK